jgi:hypothetical protein
MMTTEILPLAKFDIWRAGGTGIAPGIAVVPVESVDRGAVALNVRDVLALRLVRVC